MSLLAVTDLLHSPLSIAIMVAASIITVTDNGLAFTAIAEIAGPFWSGRALGTQNTTQLFTGAIVPPTFGALITVTGYAWRSRCARSSRCWPCRWCRSIRSAAGTVTGEG